MSAKLKREHNERLAELERARGQGLDGLKNEAEGQGIFANVTGEALAAVLSGKEYGMKARGLDAYKEVNPLRSVSDLDLAWLKEKNCILEGSLEKIEVYCLGWAWLFETRYSAKWKMFDRLHSELTQWMVVNVQGKPETEVKMVEQALSSIDRWVADREAMYVVMRSAIAEAVRIFESESESQQKFIPLHTRAYHQAERVLKRWGCKEGDDGVVVCPVEVWSTLETKHRDQMFYEIEQSVKVHSEPLNPNWDIRTQERFTKWKPILMENWEKLKSL